MKKIGRIKEIKSMVEEDGSDMRNKNTCHGRLRDKHSTTFPSEVRRGIVNPRRWSFNSASTRADTILLRGELNTLVLTGVVFAAFLKYAVECSSAYKLDLQD